MCRSAWFRSITRQTSCPGGGRDRSDSTLLTDSEFKTYVGYFILIFLDISCRCPEVINYTLIIYLIIILNR